MNNNQIIIDLLEEKEKNDQLIIFLFTSK